MSLEPNKIWVVTGAASGMGRAIAAAAVAKSYRVLAIDIDGRRLEQLAQEMGRLLQPIVLDLRNAADVSEFAIRVNEEFDQIDTLVNAAGAAQLEAVDALTAAATDFHYEVLLRGPMLMTKYLLPLLKQGENPSIINISSIGAVTNVPLHAAYASMKAALEKFSKITLVEAPEIRVNIVEPGFIDTPILLNYGSEAEVRNLLGKVADRLPSRRIGKPEDIANAVMFLASDKASYINGATLLVDGGYCANPFEFV